MKGEFTGFVSSHGRNFKSNGEYKKAKKTFAKNAARVNAYNEKHKNTDGLKMKVNKYGDLTGSEFKEAVQVNK